MNKIIVIVLCSVWLCACTKSDNQNKTVVDTQKSPKVAALPSIQLNPYYDDISRFIAGMPVDSTSRLFTMSNRPESKKFAGTMNAVFSKFEDTKLTTIKSWVASELAEVNRSTEDVLYPFSGPDIIHAHTILPTAGNYFLFGLEPVGVIPEIENFQLDSLPKLFNTIHKSVSDNLLLSFFISKNMKEDFNTPAIKGTIPILMFFMARLNLHIQDIQAVDLDSTGALVVNPQWRDQTAKKVFRTGVEISFVRPNEKRVCHVYYFSMNIADEGFQRHPELARFINSLNKKITTLVKSASYCLHDSYFSTMRNLMLNKSIAIVQDDSGIPYRFFDLGIWNTRMYGVYTRPIPLFKNKFQEDYLNAFQESPRPIAFRYGYNNPSNIMVAVKKNLTTH